MKYTEELCKSLLYLTLWKKEHSLLITKDCKNVLCLGVEDFFGTKLKFIF